MKPYVCVFAVVLVAGVAWGEDVARGARQYAEFTGVVNNPGQGWTTTVGSYGKLKDFLNVGAIYK